MVLLQFNLYFIFIRRFNVKAESQSLGIQQHRKFIKICQKAKSSQIIFFINFCDNGCYSYTVFTYYINIKLDMLVIKLDNDT